MTSDDLESQLSEHRVAVIESGGKHQRGWTTCEIDKDIEFDVEGLTAYCFADWDIRVYDAFIVAAAIQFADQTKLRPSISWGRDISVQIPVHEPLLWNSSSVSEALHEALKFLTGDKWEIHFVNRRKKAPVAPQSTMDLSNGPYVVMPYSDGLDSIAVSGLLEDEYKDQLIRVRLGPKARNKKLLWNKPFACVPYRVKGSNTRAVESSARSRGFKFALLTGIAAYLLDAKQIFVSESGQGAVGPVLVSVGQAYEDYRNHPLFTEKMSVLINRLFDHKVEYKFPRIWFTKADTLKAFVKASNQRSALIETRSCWQKQRHASVDGKLRQCGICAACMLRRMSMHAASIKDKKENYVWENLRAGQFEDGAAKSFLKKKSGAMHEYAIAGTLHLDHLANIRKSKINKSSMDRNVFYLSKSLGLSEEMTRIKLNNLLRKHEQEWSGFISSLGPRSFVRNWIYGAN